MTLSGFALSCLFIVIKLIPTGNLGVSFSVPSHIIFGVWILLGALFFIWQMVIKKEKDEAVEETPPPPNK